MPTDLAKNRPAPVAIADFQTNHNGLALHWRDHRPLRPSPSRNRRRQLAIKRGLDIVLASIGLLALMPLLLLIALAIKICDPGPVLFRQDREGLGRKNFRILKFRTMRPAPNEAGGCRTTPLGRLLRRTSLDELPQLLNVVAGDMALVGPRPHIHDMPVLDTPYTMLVPYYAQRFDMRPGITGWAQANGLRGPLADEHSAIERIDHDLAYAQNFSLALDLKILWLTIGREFLTGTGR